MTQPVTEQQSSDAEYGTTLFGKPARYASGLHTVGEGVWAWLQPNGELGESNSGLVAGDGAALLIDTLWDLRLTQAMLDELALACDQPITTLFNTHSDGDHCWGNELVEDTEIVATGAAAAMMTELMPGMLNRLNFASRAGRAIGSMPLPVVGTLKLRGVPRVPLRFLSSMLEPYDFSGINLTLPTRTFEGRLDLDIGGRKVELIEVGPAHTAGDAIAWVPDAKVCFAADILFVGGTPIMWAGPVDSWIEALDTALGLGAETYVPGHGPISTATEVELMRDYFAWVRDEGVPRMRRGASPAHAAREMLISNDFDSLPWGGWDDPARLAVTLAAEAHKIDGGTGHLDGAGRARAIYSMLNVAGELEQRRGQ
jgi:glyoxylase-like metal-dependent hydrolase (beta-lactamase superfamily II)